MIINGPFLPGIDYLGNVHEDMTPSNSMYEINIVEPNLHKYKFLRFMFRQDLHRFHTGSIIAFLQVGSEHILIPLKPTPTQVYEFIEYRVRLSSSIFQGTTGAKLFFMYPGTGYAELSLSGLMFGINADEEDIALVPSGIILQTYGGGITSPFMGYVPMNVGEVVDINLYPYNGQKVGKVEFNGDVYDENGKKYPRLFMPNEYNTFKVKYLTPFETCQIMVTFKVI